MIMARVLQPNRQGCTDPYLFFMLIKIRSIGKVIFTYMTLTAILKDGGPTLNCAL